MSTKSNETAMHERLIRWKRGQRGDTLPWPAICPRAYLKFRAKVSRASNKVTLDASGDRDWNIERAIECACAKRE